ncbi:hypothetical protein ASPWEDRAFT_169598 [Aspergillus wentii DTO 134E9]|uniref:Uncharacterized protein n=1 Tax=Aspergillus wentii DTO 134E9 TaxID=1073089 RepID=A0A1L9RY18_ASPWE|nr:uncharacterized protein ASPWEDRAFT_169598 [Aspergillus wentii DTO 134E9]KAI9931557.1 hypothetical protein MW887_010134 [Aspergillus wentii]OJJ39774.1 hypothetical protein ASPWEDRAFT_169598 [Aspergillus wentii DTO 134E9]
MKHTLYDRIWRREAGEASPYAGIRGLYGSKEWMNDLDIVNELGGHTGCVNALAWSGSGRLLASGSDDLHLNLYSYQPDSSSAPFSLNTTILTGHKANIFSVKFMPHSNDRTLITCAGDSQVRIFDIEYSNNSNNAAATTAFSNSTRSRRLYNFFTGTRYLTAGNTNTRVYRSHADRVKRIVTESSPHLFLTCSEDGEVRQWDLRQPSSAYPSPRGGQGFMAYRPGVDHDDSNVPPPLISYKRHRLDLNTISCSSSQPHYIALGGAHLHCFLHDRRMLGRDRSAEMGSPGISPVSGGSSSRDDEMMSQATQCVRRFAPQGRRRMADNDNGHITACKISDANPNEMVVSWSGDHIYSFDLIHSPDARDSSSSRQKSTRASPESRKRAGSKNKKRKRPQPVTSASTSSQESGNRHQSRLRSGTAEQGDPDSELAFRVRYGNGESEDIPFETLSETLSDAPENMIERARYSVLNEAQRLSMRIAQGLVKLRSALFSLETTVRGETDNEETGLTPYTSSFSSVLTLASSFLPSMGEIILTWRYPLNPSPETVAFQTTLRRNREEAWRFAQAAGTVARVLGGEIEGPPEDAGSDIDMFLKIMPAHGENDSIDTAAQFCYDFLRAILLWVEGGRAALLSGFKRSPTHRRNHARFPVPESADERAIETDLIPYLQSLAGDTAVVNVDASRFEHDSTRIVFQTQFAAVTAFANAVKLPLEDLNNSAARVDAQHGMPNPANVRALDRSAATRFWALKVGRGILMEAGTRVNYAFVNQAFGGLRATVEDDFDSEVGQERSQEDIDGNVEEERIQNFKVVSSGSASRKNRLDTEFEPADIEADSEDRDDENENEFGVDEDEEDEDDDDGPEMSLEQSTDEDDDDGPEMSLEQSTDDDDVDAEEHLIRRYGFQRTRREDVDLEAPCSSHTKVYRGHCNIKTVKDVNFYGLNDEYVVSGCDSGNIFIWDRKTADLVNILEADSEVVNVVQGHPYEPTIAASGIDNTIKIFSPDQHAQENARRGINILDPDNPANTLGRGAAVIGGLKSRKRIQDSYKIMSQNDVDRQGGMSEAFITRSMLAQLAANLRDRNAGAQAAGANGGDEGRTIVLDEDCTVM